ncbi:hypothetical protein HG535_0H03730 [Zygotorulaspora mrakii]|uniref:RRM domain-containing protein n=1 Tax=Zygotorulaspora mrakii TaxID=42260 RepID=A0A7H9B9J0_ZYGMR|nr:uncharacterized protein HG535_0H03730 [Zygotorulaspora mrakii]QLG75046.1 hypothetical protein HG535_0H03730 [Zygotorulaspora mrakii]
MSAEGNAYNANARIEIDPETTIFVGHLPLECTEQDLEKLFSGEDEAVEVEIIPTRSKTGRSMNTRYGFVKFPQKVDFDAIKEKYDRAPVNEKPISVRKVLTQEERSAEREKKMRNRKYSRNGAQGARDASRPGNFGNRGPAVPDPPKKDKTPLEEMERSTDTLYVNNIPYHATKEELGEFFGTEPELIVLPMRRMKDTETKRVFFSKKMNRGIAFVTFESLSEGEITQKVESFQGKSFQERPITVDVAAVRPAQEKVEAPNEETKQ